jgi:hypothetical protein
MISRVSAWCARLKNNDGKHVTGRIESAMAQTISRHDRRWACLYAAFFLALTAAGNLFAQENAPGNEAQAGEVEKDTSQQVDESEESFRTRMELRDQRFRQQPRADMTYSSGGEKSKLDQLPEASREHIKEQLRDMIMASHQWKPGEDLSDYPYEPSTAAQADAKLRSLEREAWAEQLQKYQQREAAAYATAKDGKVGEQGGQEGGKGTEGAGTGETNGSAGAGSQAASEGQANSARNSEPYTGRDQAMEAVSTAGVSESALSFLQSKGGQMGESDPQTKTAAGGEADDSAVDDSGSASESPDATTPPGSLALSELAQLQGMNAAPGGTSDDPSAQQSMDTPAASSAQQPSPDQNSADIPAAEDVVEMMPGTLDIDDLKNMDSSAAQGNEPAVPGTVTAEVGQQAAATPVEPGTLAIEELRQLDGDG